MRFVDNEEIMGREDPLRAAKEVHRPARLEDCLVDVRFPIIYLILIIQFNILTKQSLDRASSYCKEN